MTINLHVFVIHAGFLSVRKPIIESLIQKLKACGRFTVNEQFITAHDPQTIPVDAVRSMIDLTKRGEDIFDPLVKNIHIKQLSNIMKHKEAIQKASELPSGHIAMIIEDDCLHGDDVDLKLFNSIQKLQLRKEEWDVCFLGLPQPANDQKSQSEFMRPVQDVYKLQPVVESYIVRPETAKKVHNAFSPIRFSTNIQFSYIAYKHPDIKIMMTTNNVFIDGTKYGVYISTIEPNNKLFLNTDFNKLYQITHKETLSDEDVKVARSTLEAIKFKEHPDVIALEALLEMKIGSYEKSKELYEKAHSIYTGNDSILNNESEFLLQYTRIFKFTQSLE